VDGELPVEQEGHQAVVRVLRGIGFAGNQVVDLGEHVAHIEGCEGPPVAFLVVARGVIDRKIRGIGEVTSLHEGSPGPILRAGFTRSPETEPALPLAPCVSTASGTSCTVVFAINTSSLLVARVMPTGCSLRVADGYPMPTSLVRCSY
jgi:hypothetical protein